MKKMYENRLCCLFFNKIYFFCIFGQIWPACHDNKKCQYNVQQINNMGIYTAKEFGSIAWCLWYQKFVCAIQILLTQKFIKIDVFDALELSFTRLTGAYGLFIFKVYLKTWNFSRFEKDLTFKTRTIAIISENFIQILSLDIFLNI